MGVDVFVKVAVGVGVEVMVKVGVMVGVDVIVGVGVNVISGMKTGVLRSNKSLRIQPPSYGINSGLLCP